jgi:GR25 family glycosyltransferase involved in LPS biosynthesis
MKAKIIVLKNNSLSERIARDCITQAAKFGISVEVFDAINGLEYKTHLEKLNIKRLKKFKKDRAGVYGCFLSHYYLWMECVKDNEPYLILEHDGFLTKPLPNDILNHFSDVLKLDAGDPYSGDYENEIIRTQNDPLVYKVIDPVGDLNNGAGWYSRGAYVYIIKPHAAKKLIDWISINGFLPADQQIGLDVVTVHECLPCLGKLHEYYTKEKNIKTMSTTMNEGLL